MMAVFSRNEKWLIGAAFLLCAALYWPALSGLPVWDDLGYWIHNPDMRLPYSVIWRFFTWPLSTTVQKFMLDFFGENYFAYHLVNLSLHFLNSLFVFAIAKRLNWPKPTWIFLLFLFHPANVGVAGWMIQIKTLLCFLFAALAFMAFDRGLQDRRFMWLAVVLFCLSLLSKSASVTLPVLLLVYAYPRVSRRVLSWCLAFVLVGALCGVIIIARNPKFETTAVRANTRIELIAMTTRYYLAQSIVPLENAPIKGRSRASAGFLDLTVLGVLLAVVFFIRKTTNLIYIVSAYVLLLPFLGIVLAPYMVFTWVSDHHLYLAMPLFLAFWVSLISRLPERIQPVILASLLALFGFKTYRTSWFYHDEDRFYTESLRSDPGNVIAAFNYANTYAYSDQVDKAMAITERIHTLSEKDKSIVSQPRFLEIEKLREQLIAFKKWKQEKPK